MHGHAVVLAKLPGEQGRAGRVALLLGEAVAPVHHLVDLAHHAQREVAVRPETEVGGHGAVVPEHVEELGVGVGEAAEVGQVVHFAGELVDDLVVVAVRVLVLAQRVARLLVLAKWKRRTLD